MPGPDARRRWLGRGWAWGRGLGVVAVLLTRPVPVLQGADTTPPLQALAGVVRQLTEGVLREPPAGRCHRLEARAEIRRPGRPPQTFHLALVRGEGERFQLAVEPLPEVGSLRLGNGAYPWLVSRDGTVFLGRADPAGEPSLPSLVDARQGLRLKAWAGAVQAMASAPELVAAYLTVTEAPAPQGERRLGVVLQHLRVQGQGSVRLRGAAAVPTEIRFAAAGIEGTVTIEQWALDAPSSPAQFREPSGPRRCEVPRADLLRMMTALAGFVLESSP